MTSLNSQRSSLNPASNSQLSALNTPTGGRYAYEGLEREIHEKARLEILTALAANSEGLLFGDLKELCSLTDGNLSRHLAVLQEALLVEVWKGTRNNRPQTLCRLTATGRERFRDYLRELERLISDASSGLGGRNSAAQ